MPQSTSKFNPGDAVIVSDSAMIYSGLDIFDNNESRVGIVICIENARDRFDLDNDDNLVETLLPGGLIEWIWEVDLDLLN